MKGVITMATVVALGACDSTVVTPPGASVLEFRPSSKLSVSDWKLGAPKGDAEKIETTYRYKPGELGDPVRFKLIVERGPAEFVAASPKPDKPETIRAPRLVKIEVVENGAWAMTGSCEDDLSVPLAVRADGTSAYPESVWARCLLAMKRKNGEITVSVHFEVDGKEPVKASALGNDHELVAE